MSISYSENNKRETIFEPLLGRQRLIYKGPVSSNVLNLVNDQFFMDVNRLDKKTELLQELIDQSSDISRNDMSAATPDYYTNESMLMTVYSQYISYNESIGNYQVELASPSYNVPVNFNKPQHNSAIIALLNKKLDLIEDALKDEN